MKKLCSNVCWLVASILVASCSTTEQWKYSFDYSSPSAVWDKDRVVAYILTGCTGNDCETLKCTDPAFERCRSVQKCNKSQIVQAEYKGQYGSVTTVQLCPGIDLHALIGGGSATAHLKQAYRIKFKSDDIEKYSENGYRVDLRKVKDANIDYRVGIEDAVCAYEGSHGIKFEADGKTVTPKYVSDKLRSAKNAPAIEGITCTVPMQYQNFVETE